MYDLETYGFFNGALISHDVMCPYCMYGHNLMIIRSNFMAMVKDGAIVRKNVATVQYG